MVWPTEEVAAFSRTQSPACAWVEVGGYGGRSLQSLTGERRWWGGVALVKQAK